MKKEASGADMQFITSGLIEVWRDEENIWIPVINVLSKHI